MLMLVTWMQDLGLAQGSLLLLPSPQNCALSPLLLLILHLLPPGAPVTWSAYCLLEFAHTGRKPGAPYFSSLFDISLFS